MNQQYTLRKKFLADVVIRVRRVYKSAPPGTMPPIAFADPPGLVIMEPSISHHVLFAHAVRELFLLSESCISAICAFLRWNRCSVTTFVTTSMNCRCKFHNSLDGRISLDATKWSFY